MSKLLVLFSVLTALVFVVAVDYEGHSPYLIKEVVPIVIAFVW